MAPADPTPPAVPPARERIVLAALREFAERGFDGGRIDAIARAAGVNKALLYYYFPNKQALYRGLVLDHLQALGQRLAAAEDPALPAGESLERFVATFLQLAEARPFAPLFLMREILNSWGHLEDDDFAVLFAQARPVVETVRRGVASGEFRPVPPLFVHLLLTGGMNLFLATAGARARGARLVGQPDLDPDPRAFARFLADLLVRGLTADGPAPPPPGVPA